MAHAQRILQNCCFSLQSFRWSSGSVDAPFWETEEKRKKCALKKIIFFFTHQQNLLDKINIKGKSALFTISFASSSSGDFHLPILKENAHHLSKLKNWRYQLPALLAPFFSRSIGVIAFIIYDSSHVNNNTVLLHDSPIRLYLSGATY